ncbi:T9SS type A sorting domain-containing protein [Flavobacteriaceae bacterium TP-CH-4]|uniref:T9SS type A sorting domain-containing protein n=1 Tax=Pelagihabitans pacificus TaxID=2696054 RepID=A0A967ARF5_9FLAO|nr:G8 domain-containing protein [Pelagihabitans pacificus]NHF58627.1 T9SS type A sorting domain-containing protein [Pelagihabitans pacificus]
MTYKNAARFLYLFFALTAIPCTLLAQQNWSNPSSWASGEVPKANQDIRIPADKTILLDVSPPNLGNLVIEGSLIFEDKNLSLTAETIKVMGLLQIGTAETPFQSNATITLNGPKVDEEVFGGRFLTTLSGGSLQLHGASAAKLSWGQLEGTVQPGATSITLDQTPVGWETGDKIAIAPSGYEPYEAEELTITGVAGNTISFVPALQFPHFGEIQEYEGKLLDERAEVGMLTRNIKIRGAQDSEEQRFGGHTMILNESGPIHIEGVEFTLMGQPGIEARYNMHWHLAGDREGDYIKNSSIHHSLQRGVVIHRTDNVLVEDVVAYNVRNHVFIPAEDGPEINNTFRHNLAILVRKPEKGFFAFPRDGGGGSNQGEQRVGGFWMRNVHNNLIDNHVAGSERGTGFFFDTRGRSRDFREIDLLPREVVFDGNVAHSCSVPGNLGNEGISNTALYSQVGHGHGFFMTTFNPGDLMWTFNNFTSYKNAMSGVWTEITNVTLDNFMIADNAIGLLSSESHVQNTVVIGKSANTIGGKNRHLRHGDRRAGYYSIAQGGRKQPKLTNVTFIDINKDVEEGKVAAAVIGHGGHRGKNFFRSVQLKGETLPVWMSTRGSKGDNENSSFLLDEDGSLTGYDRPVLIAHPYSSFRHDAIEYREEWQAYILEAEGAMQLKMNGIGFDLEQEVSLIRDFDRLRIPKQQHAHQRFFNFFGQQSYTIVGQWEIDEKDNYLELRSVMEKEGEWTTFKHPFPYTGILVLDREDNPITQVNSLAELDAQQATAYYFDPAQGAVYLKMVTDETGYSNINLIPQGEKTGNNYGIEYGDIRQFVLDAKVYPNPLSADSRLEYTLLQDQVVAISIYDILGRKVKTLLVEEQEDGFHSVPIGEHVMQSGTYVVDINFLVSSLPIKIIKP